MDRAELDLKNRLSMWAGVDLDSSPAESSTKTHQSLLHARKLRVEQGLCVTGFGLGRTLATELSLSDGLYCKGDGMCG